MFFVCSAKCIFKRLSQTCGIVKPSSTAAVSSSSRRSVSQLIIMPSIHKKVSQSSKSSGGYSARQAATLHFLAIKAECLSYVALYILLFIVLSKNAIILPALPDKYCLKEAEVSPLIYLSV